VSKLLDLLERVAPHIALFPRWAKSLLLVTLASVALSVIVYAGWHDSALRARNAAAASRDVTADLTGSGGNNIGLLKRRLARVDGERIVDYANSGGDPTMRITPVAPYLDKLADGGPIRAGDFYGISTADLPLLDLKVTNNGKRVVYLTRAVFDVESSRPDPTAIPVVDELQFTARTFTIGNEGWGAMRRVEVRYRVVPPGTHGALERPFPVKTTLRAVHEDAFVDVSPGLRAAGVDVAAIRRVENARRGYLTGAQQQALRRALGPFRGTEATAAGEIAYVTQTPSGKLHRRKVTFEVPVKLVRPNEMGGGGSVGTPTHYNVRLRVSGRGYRQIVGIAEELRPGAVKRFEIRVFARRSSLHRLRVHLEYGNGEIVTAPTELRLFVPRTHETPVADVDVDGSRSS
jgi:hypothetical protein